MRDGWVLVVLLATSLAGCSDGAAKETLGLQDDLKDYDVKVSSTTGALRGVVVDDAIRPVANASVRLPSAGATATTGSDGLFGFPDLQPGVYFLNVTAPGYLPVQQSAEVAAGQVVDLRVLLGLDPRPQPYHRTIGFDWFDEAGVTLVDFTVDLVDRAFLNDSLPDACDVCYFYFDVDGPYETLVLEIVWEDSLEFPLRPTSYFWTLDALTVDDYEADYCESPCRVEVGGDRFPNELRYGVGLSGDENWVTFQQEAEIFVTAFYNTPAPEGWSFVAGDP